MQYTDKPEKDKGRSQNISIIASREKEKSKKRKKVGSSKSFTAVSTAARFYFRSILPTSIILISVSRMKIIKLPKSQHLVKITMALLSSIQYFKRNSSVSIFQPRDTLSIFFYLSYRVISILRSLEKSKGQGAKGCPTPFKMY